MTYSQRVWAIAAIAFMGGVGGGVVFPILPVVGAQLGISGLMIGVILSANRFVRLFFNPVTGSLLDRFGSRWPVAVGLALEALGSGIYSVALFAHWHALWFLAGRIIWGLGSSLLLVGVLSAIMVISKPGDRGSMTARVRTALTLGFPGGLFIGGLVAELASDNAAFLTATAMSLLAGLAATRVLPDQTSESHKENQPTGESRAAWRKIFAIRTLRTVFAVNALLYFAVSGVLLATVALAIETRHIEVFGMGAQGSAGLLMTVLMAARATTALSSGRYLDRHKARTRLLLPAMAGTAIGFFILALAANLPAIIAGLLCIGAGSGGLTIPMLTLLGDVTPPAIHGRALAVYQWAADLGGAAGPITGLTIGSQVGFGPVYFAVGILMLAMAWPLRVLIVRERNSDNGR